MKQLIILLVALLCTTEIRAQELNARVEVSAPQLQNLNPRTIELLKNVVSDFLNSRSWTGRNVRPEERIDCSFNIIINSFDGTKNFQATAQVNSARPVFGTNYNSPVLSFRDRQFNFLYEEGEQLDFNENQNMGTLSALFAFYAHVIVGMDLDTFRLQGGSAVLNSARNIMNQAQNLNVEGWRAMDGNESRYWLITNLTSGQYTPYREFAYKYHRDGLDKMVDNEAEAKKLIAELMPRLKDVNRFNTGNVWTSALFTAKANEFVGVFSKMPGNESMKMYNLLVELDPTNQNKYEAIKN